MISACMNLIESAVDMSIKFRQTQLHRAAVAARLLSATSAGHVTHWAAVWKDPAEGNLSGRGPSKPTVL